MKISTVHEDIVSIKKKAEFEVSKEELEKFKAAISLIRKYRDKAAKIAKVKADHVSYDYGCRDSIEVYIEGVMVG